MNPLKIATVIIKNPLANVAFGGVAISAAPVLETVASISVPPIVAIIGYGALAVGGVRWIYRIAKG